MRATIPNLIPLVCSLALSAGAASLTAPASGSFSWNAANAWNAGTATWNSGTPDDAVFNHSGGRTATVNGATTAGSVTVTMDSNTLTFNSDTLTINGNLTKDGAGNLRVDNVLAGDFSANVNGGVLELRNVSNTFTGGITVANGATVRVGSANGALGTGLLTLQGGSTFAFGVGGSGVTVPNNVGVTGNVTLANTRNSGSASFSIGTAGVSTVNLNGATRTLNATTSNIGDIINVLGTLSNGGFTVTGNAVLRFGGSTGSNTYTGTTTLDAGYTGTLQLSKAAGNSVAGDLVVNGGTLMLRFDNNIADTSTVTLNAGTFRLQDEGANNRTDVISSLVFHGGAFDGGGGLALGAGPASNGQIRINAGGVLGGNGSGLNRPVLMTGNGTIQAGTLGLGGDFTVSGSGNLISQGTLTVAGTATINNGAVLTVGTGGSDGYLNANLTHHGTLVFHHGNNRTHGFDITGNGAFTKSGAGSLSLTGTTALGGAVSVQGGSLDLDGGSHAAASFLIAGADFSQATGVDWTTDLFHVQGSGGTIQVAELALAAGPTGVLRYTVDTGGVSTVQLTAANPFAQYDANPSLGLAAWASEWTLDLNTVFGLGNGDFSDLNLLSSSAYDLSQLNGQLSIQAWDEINGIPVPTLFNNVQQGDTLYLQGTGALAKYNVQFSASGVDLIFASSRAIPEPGTLGLLGLALLLLRRRLLSRGMSKATLGEC